MMWADPLYHHETEAHNAGLRGLRAGLIDFLWPIVAGVTAGWALQHWGGLGPVFAYGGGFAGAVMLQVCVDGARRLFTPRPTTGAA